MIAVAREYLEDKLYVRAAAQYQSALAAYDTENDLRYEGELLALYQEGGMTEEYYALIRKRIGTGDAAMEEYLELPGGIGEQGDTRPAAGHGSLRGPGSGGSL